MESEFHDPVGVLVPPDKRDRGPVALYDDFKPSQDSGILVRYFRKFDLHLAPAFVTFSN